ncbi:GAF domain-containing protein [Sabulicella glaciei]|uniref:GAF domain-containing protein n=1 Tax=Sabulicella glaciei TaxID=2984948 RepID=A0ABT3NPZ9_9PROT|nr:GAF domain-containing protein [Roseococcus sp. MDT2-1-1]
MTLALLTEALTLPDQPRASFAALDAAGERLAGRRLFTILLVDEARGVTRRVHSSEPQTWLLGQEAPIHDGSDFHDLVVRQGRARFCKDAEEMARAFPRHEELSAFGCESAVNLPVRWAGRTIGSLNLHDRAGHYSEAQMPVLAILGAFAVAPLLHLMREGTP